jgi:WD40 repeat protein
MLYSAGLDSKIHCYDIFKGQDSQEIGSTINLNDAGDDKNEIRGHKVKDHCITDLLPIPEMNLIASASTDKNMILWSINDLKFKSAHTDHQKPIYCLEWYADQQLILSAGMDHDIYIWNPIVKDKIFKLQGHNHSMVGVKWLKGTN